MRNDPCRIGNTIVRKELSRPPLCHLRAARVTCAKKEYVDFTWRFEHVCRVRWLSILCKHHNHRFSCEVTIALHRERRTRESGCPAWIPAFAGMTCFRGRATGSPLQVLPQPRIECEIMRGRNADAIERWMIARDQDVVLLRHDDRWNEEY